MPPGRAYFRGESFTALGDFKAAENELKFVKKIADEIKGVRLQWDVHAALEKLYRALGERGTGRGAASKCRSNRRSDQGKSER